jgi:tetratricopeptide (TPR) repeat protein
VLDRRTVVGALLVCVLAAAAGAAFFLWRAQEREVIALAGVPEVPDLSRWHGDFEREVREANAAVREEQNPIEPLAWLAGLYHINGYTAQATQALTALHRLDPTNARWIYLRADLQFRADERDAAETSLRQVLELDPSYLPAWIRVGNLLIQRGAIDAARETHVRAVEVAPQDVRALVYQLAFEVSRGEGSDSRSRLDRLVELHPDIAETHELLSVIHTQDGNQDASERERQLAVAAPLKLSDADPWVDDLARHCFDIERMSAYAGTAALDGRFDFAEYLLMRAIQIAPSEPSLLKELQSLYLRMGRPEDALRVLETAAADALDDPELRALQADLLSAQGRFKEAISLLQAALQRRPDAAQLYAALGPALGFAGRPVASVRALREAVRLDPTLVDAQFNLGISFQVIGQVGAARIAAERVLSMRPDHLDAHVLLASLALESGDLETAESTLNRLMNLRPDANARAMFAALQYRKGVEAEQSGNCASAEGHYRAGLEVAPRYPPLLRAIGLLECSPSAEFGPN